MDFGKISELHTALVAGEFYQKQMFQSTLFPAGLGYDAKIDHYRSTEINSEFSYISDLSRDLAENKNRTSLNFKEKSGLVPHTGHNLNGNLEDARVLAQIWDLYGSALADKL